jgi:hypothetical protein
MAVVRPDERSAAAGVTAVARSVGASISPMLGTVFVGTAARPAAQLPASGGYKQRPIAPVQPAEGLFLPRFELPDRICRQRIWEKHLVPELPRACDVTAEELAKIEGICGRDIKNAIVDAARRVAYNKRDRIELSDLISAVERLIAARPSTSMTKDTAKP